MHGARFQATRLNNGRLEIAASTRSDANKNKTKQRAKTMRRKQRASKTSKVKRKKAGWRSLVVLFPGAGGCRCSRPRRRTTRRRQTPPLSSTRPRRRRERRGRKSCRTRRRRLTADRQPDLEGGRRMEGRGGGKGLSYVRLEQRRTIAPFTRAHNSIDLCRAGAP